MKRRFRGARPSPALVIAVIALFVAMGGTSYAALKLPTNSVGAKQIKANAVSSTKIKNGSLVSKDFKVGALPTTVGPKGATGAKGDPGTPGAKGDTGPSNAYFSTGGNLVLPAGDYIVHASATDDNSANTTTSSTVTCTIGSLATGSITSTSSGTAPPSGKVTIPIEGAAHFTSDDTNPVGAACTHTGSGTTASAGISAIQVGTLTTP